MKRRKHIPNRLLTDTFREIRNTRSRFISILVLSALAVCFLAGLRATEPDMKLSADRYFDQQALMDLRIVGTLGLTQADVDALAGQKGVERAEGAYTVDAVLSRGGNDYVLKAHSLSDHINLPRLVEGRMPKTDREVLVEPALLAMTGLGVGDTITLDTGEGSYKDALKEDTFTIVGTADTPLYISGERGSATLGNGTADAYVLIPAGAFDMESYTDAYLRLTGGAALETYSQAYEDLVDALVPGLEALGELRAPIRQDQVLGEANQALADAQQQLADARAEVEKKLEEARAELDKARAELDKGWADYEQGLLDFDTQIADGQAQIDQGLAELDQALATLKDSQAQLDAGQAELDAGWKEYYDGVAAFEEGYTQFKQGWTAYYEGLAQYEDGLAQYEDGRRQLDEGWQAYYDGLAQYEDGLAALEEGRRTLTEQENTFEQGLTALRLMLPMVDSALSYADNEALLDAMADPVQAAAIDAALDTLRGQSTQARAELAQQEAELARLDERIARLNEQIDALEDETIAQLDGQIAQMDRQIQQLQLQLLTTWDAQEREQLQGQLDDLQAQRDALQEQRSRENEQLTALEEELARLEQERSDLQSQINTKRQQVQTLQSVEEGLYTTVDGQRVPVTTKTLLWGREQLDQGWAELEAGQAQLEAGAAQFDDGRKQLEESERQLDDVKDTLDQARRQLSQSLGQLEAGQAQMDAAKAQLDAGKAELDKGQAELDAGQAQLDKGWKEYYDGQAQLKKAQATLDREAAQGRRELADAKAKLEQGEADYEEGEADFLAGRKEAQAEIADAQKELEQAQRDIDAIQGSQWYVLDRNTNMGYVSYSMDAQRMGNLASVFPLIFFLVAALVCLTTMTRMVEEQRVTIGGMKALGYSRGAISVKYVGYGLLASLVGSLAGLAVGLSLVPWIICTAWGIMYTTGDLYFSLEPVTSALACAAAVGTVTLSAWGACASALKAVPAQLMRPKAPPMGKRILLERIGPLWRSLSFNYKVTLRNLFRYQKRFWMTVLGIGGCAALIITAFGLRDSIFAVADMQYQQLYTYDAQVSLVDKATPGELAEVTGLLDDSEQVKNWLVCRSEMVSAQTDAYTVDATFQVFPDGASVTPFMDLRHRTDGADVKLDDEGVVLTEKLAKLLDVQAGDTFVLDGERRVEVRVADVTEHYIQHYIYMTQAYYQQVMGQPAQDNLVMVAYRAGVEDTRELDKALVALDGVTSLSRVADSQQSMDTSMASVDYAVVLIIVCAAALAFVVLYNLTNINITERMRELATLKVLGFYDGELSAYVYRENVFLTIFGVLMGLVLGKLLHQWLILTVEIDMLMFGREVATASYLYAVVLTTLFSLLVNLSAHKKLKKLDMVQSLKSVE